MEGSSIDVTFTAQLETGETLVSINITSYEETPGVLVEENRLYGTYESVFGFGNDALKYRLGDEFKTAASWEELPTDSILSCICGKLLKTSRRHSLTK
ncbi:hypothetical protein KMC23_gp260 [Escherichia phage T2]|nr:hypothetical protein KMC23_gp260 [Escherichia phage T2]BBC14768.1 hypothetical protein [Escherichia phage T2]